MSDEWVAVITGVPIMRNNSECMYDRTLLLGLSVCGNINPKNGIQSLVNRSHRVETAWT